MSKLLPLLLLALHVCCHAQSWSYLVSSPTSVSFRHDDVFFIHPDTGWVCNVDGEVHRTTDGGASWEVMHNAPAISFRCVGFADAAKGWCGNLGPGRWSPTLDTFPLYQTLDSGHTWTAAPITGPLPDGVCGIHVLDANVIHAVGRVGGPAYLLTTTDGGASWTSKDMNALARDLIDVKFFTPDSGLVSGSVPDGSGSYTYAIFHTGDGGTTWNIVVQGKDSVQLAWKLFFLDRNLGFASVESVPDHDSLPVLKTTDGGLTWQRKLLSPGAAPFIQGIGFMDALHGWVGGYGLDARATTDGGDTWVNTPMELASLNRLRRVNDTLGYAVGKRVWKYSATSTSALPAEARKPAFKAGPNPFHEHFQVEVSLSRSQQVSIRLYEVSGRPVKVLHRGHLTQGDHWVPCHLPWQGTGQFILVVETEDGWSAQLLQAH